MNLMRCASFLLLAGAVFLFPHNSVSAGGTAFDDYTSFAAQSGWIEELGVCGNEQGFIAHDCTACNLSVGFGGACMAYCAAGWEPDYSSCSEGRCVCAPCEAGSQDPSC